MDRLMYFPVCDLMESPEERAPAASSSARETPPPRPAVDATTPLQNLTPTAEIPAIEKLCLFHFIDPLRRVTANVVRNLTGKPIDLPELPPMIMTGERLFLENMRLVLRYLKQVGKACKREQAHKALEEVLDWRATVKCAHDLDEDSAKTLLKYDDEDFEFLHKKSELPISPSSATSGTNASTVPTSPAASDQEQDTAQDYEECDIEVDPDKKKTATNGQASVDNRWENDQIAMTHWTTLESAEEHEPAQLMITWYDEPRVAVDENKCDLSMPGEQHDTADACQQDNNFTDEGLEFEYDFDYPLQETDSKNTEVTELEPMVTTTKDTIARTQNVGEEVAQETPAGQQAHDDALAVASPEEHELVKEDHPAETSAPKQHENLLHVFLFPREDGPSHETTDASNISAQEEPTAHHDNLTRFLSQRPKWLH